jgi:hypothetical protein
MPSSGSVCLSKIENACGLDKREKMSEIQCTNAAEIAGHGG